MSVHDEISELDMLVDRLNKGNEFSHVGTALMSQSADEIQKLRAENERLKAGIFAVNDLIEASDGVTGLHLNGDVATWDELLESGRYEEWLIDFSKALQDCEN